MNRRAFLQTVAAAATGFALDPSRLLYVPGAKTLYLPGSEIIAAKSLADALSKSLKAVWPDGGKMELLLNAGELIRREYAYTHRISEYLVANDVAFEWAVQREIAAIRASGGRVVPNRQWKKYAVGGTRTSGCGETSTC